MGANCLNAWAVTERRLPGLESILGVKTHGTLGALATYILIEGDAETLAASMFKYVMAMVGVSMALAVAAACGAEPVPTATSAPQATATPILIPPTATPTPVEDADSVQATLLRHEERWATSSIAAPAYSYIGAWTCFCPQDYLAEARVTVRDGAVTAVTSADPTVQTIPEPGRFLPIEGLFSLIHEAIAQKAARIEVSYDEHYGYPVELFIDHEERRTDEETRFTISNLARE